LIGEKKQTTKNITIILMGCTHSKSVAKTVENEFDGQHYFHPKYRNDMELPPTFRYKQNSAYHNRDVVARTYGAGMGFTGGDFSGGGGGDGGGE